MFSFIQANLNRSGYAQNLLSKYIIERKISIVCVSEPGRILINNPYWFYSKSELAAVCWSPAFCKSVGAPVHFGRNFVAIKFLDLCVLSVYISPNSGTRCFSDSLYKLRNFCSTCDSSRIVICGDFNAHSYLWGCSRDNLRRKRLEGWMSKLDFRIGNIGNEPTCVRPQDTSIVDITIISASLVGHISDWHVIGDMETTTGMFSFGFLGVW